MTHVDCGATCCIHHDGGQCTLIEIELKPETVEVMLWRGEPGKEAVTCGMHCADFAIEEAAWRDQNR